MKRICITFLLVCILTLGMTNSIFAEESGLVRIDGNGEIEVEDFNLEEFQGMAPGDSRVEEIRVRNDYDRDMNFYVSMDSVKSLEETNDAAGGSYELDMRIGDSYSEAVSLLNKAAGGYDSDGKASSQGLKEIDELSGQGEFLVKLAPGQETNIYLTLDIYGEGNDREGYANAVGQLSFAFAAQQTDKASQPTIIERVHNLISTNPITRYVQTGDNGSYISYLLLLLGGVVIIFVSFKAIRNKKGDRIHEND